MHKRIIAALCAFLLLLSGCGGTKAEENTVSFFAMDTYMSLRVWNAEDTLLRQAEDLVYTLEAELSATREGSAVYTLNREGEAAFSEEAAALLKRALSLCEETDGNLDISVYPVVRAWGFTSADGDYRVPDEEERQALLERVGYTRIRLEGNTVSLPEGMEIDLGAVAKGYTGDRIVQLLRENGVESALLDLGGNIQTIGTKPDGSFWRIAVKDPESDGVLGVIEARDQAVVTSGGYERFFIDEDGVLRWHIMDPATASPAQSGLLSVTIVASEGFYADALSTSLFVMGPEEAIQFWRDRRDFEMALVTESGALLLTPELAAVFTPDSGLSLTVEVIGDA